MFRGEASQRFSGDRIRLRGAICAACITVPLGRTDAVLLSRFLAVLTGRPPRGTHDAMLRTVSHPRCHLDLVTEA